MKELEIKIEKKEIKALSRKLRSSFTIEAMQDIKSIDEELQSEYDRQEILHKFDVLFDGKDPNDISNYPALQRTSMYETMVAEITAELDREIIDEMKKLK